MDESINTANKKKNRQKPPLSVFRIAGEILVGTVTGFAIAVPVSYVILHGLLCMFLGEPVDWPESGEWGVFGFLVLFVGIISFLIMYIPAAAFGVYLVGNIGKQTGSFLLTLGGGILGGLVMFLLLRKELLSLTGEKIVIYGLFSLTGPIMATLAFNLTRRYKEPPSI